MTTTPSLRDAAQAVGISEKELGGFLTDVITAAGLLMHGKQCKALAQRIGDTAFELKVQINQSKFNQLPPCNCRTGECESKASHTCHMTKEIGNHEYQ